MINALAPVTELRIRQALLEMVIPSVIKDLKVR